MDETAEVCVNKIKVAAHRYPGKNMVAIKYSALGNYESIKQCNVAQKNVIDFYSNICKSLGTQELTVKQVEKNF